MFQRVASVVRRVFTTVYAPEPLSREFSSRAQTQSDSLAQVTVAVLSSQEGHRLCGVPIARRGIQAVFLRIQNRRPVPIRLYMSSIDPHYFTPLEAAGLNHFSVLKRLSGWGIVGWYFFPFLLLLLPFKLFTAYRANRRMDDCFRTLGFHLRPIPSGATSEGFVFTPIDAGVKVVTVSLFATSGLIRNNALPPEAVTEAADADPPPHADFTFSLSVPGLTADYQHRDFDLLCPADQLVDCNLAELMRRLAEMPAATANASGKKQGDPVNLVVIGQFETLIGAFAARWDESETITLATCWKTGQAFLRGTEYRYSPVSPLHLFGRSQDVALQRIRQSINERIHLRLWMTPLRFEGQPVWVGQISRDIGVRFTMKAWNLMTHRIDPDVDESRDYMVEDLLRAARVEAVGYVGGVGACDAQDPRRNLTGDPYFTDGKRAAILISLTRVTPRLVAWG